MNYYQNRGEVTAIVVHTRNGALYEALIDTEDLEKVQSVGRKWFISTIQGRNVVTAHTIGNKHTIYLSRVILGVTDPSVIVDYANHDTLNNLKDNLIITSKSGSGLLRKGANSNNKSSGVIGVSWHKKASKWMAQISHKRKHYYLGLHETIEQAAQEVETARRKLLGTEQAQEVRR